MKDIYVDAEIWLEMVLKRQFVSLLFFVTPSSIQEWFLVEWVYDGAAKENTIFM